MENHCVLGEKMRHKAVNSCGDRRDAEIFTIYVSNLPEELNEDGIRQIFNTYGVICSLFSPPKSNWAYVGYQNYREAEHAIRALNERSPLYLSVAFRRKKAETKNETRAEPRENIAQISVDDYRNRSNGTCENVESQKMLMPAALFMNVPGLRDDRPRSDVNFVYPNDPNSDIYNPYESAGRYASTNNLWSRGIMSVDEAGKRYVSMGRGYTKYHIPEPRYPQIEQQLGQLYEERRAGFYRYGEDRLQREIGKCQYCGNMSKLRCEKCDGYYCSRDCQIVDWPRHKTQCIIMPNLIGDSDSSVNESIVALRKPRGIVEHVSLAALRRPKKTSSKEANIVEGSMPITSTTKSPSVSTEVAAPIVKPPPVALQETPPKIDKPETRNAVCSASREIATKVESPSASVAAAKTDYLKLEREMAFRTSEPRGRTSLVETAPMTEKHISPCHVGDLVKVTVVIVMPDETFWLSKMDDLPKLAEMMLELQSKADDYPEADDLKIGEIYIARFETIWHRARLLSLNPTTLLYIDFGNVEIHRTGAADLRCPNRNDDYIAHPAFAFLSRFSPSSRRSERPSPDDELSVRILGMDENGITLIGLEGEERDDFSSSKNVEKSLPKMEDDRKTSNVAATSAFADTSKIEENEKSPINLPNVIDSFTKEGKGFVQVYAALGADSYAVCVLNSECIEPYQMIFETLTDVCNAIEKPNNWNPSMGDFVCGKRGDVWVRGYVRSLGPPVRLDLVDEARVSSIEKALPIPDDFNDISSFGSIISLDDAASVVLEVDETGEFKIDGIVEAPADGQRILKGHLLSPDKLKGVRFTLKNWRPVADQKGIDHARLANNSEVCISAYRSERLMYVRSLDAESQDRFHRIIQNVAKWALKAPQLTKMPVIGQLVIAKFVDKNWYRAVVTKIIEDEISVAYVDYGNIELTTIDNLRLLSDELKEKQSCISKVILRGITVDAPPTKEVHQYLDLLVGKEQPLVCTFDGNPTVDGVTLTTTTGEVVNTTINTLLIPEWQREDPSKNLDCFMLEDLELACLGEVGTTVQAIPLCPVEPPFKYILTPVDHEHLSHITSLMPKLAEKYCESAKHYIPRRFELCLALWENAWYRGYCVNRNATPTQAEIHFVDFGNKAIVNHTDIRQMTKDFMSPPALALSCVVKNLGVKLVQGKVPETTLRRVEELLPMSDLFDVKILRKSSPENRVMGDYEIELPELRQKLVAEGLAVR